MFNLIFLLGFLFNCQGIHAPTIPAPVTQEYGHLRHVGVDYGTVPVGSPAYAVLDSIVVLTVEDSPVYGRLITLKHCDGYLSLYAHLSKIFVERGQFVRAGTVIGLTGGDPYDNIDGDGQSTGFHLHFEVRVPGHHDSNLYNIDPVVYMRMASMYKKTPIQVRRYLPQ